MLATRMTPSEFAALADRTLNAIEDAVTSLADEDAIDIEASRSGPVLTIECEDRSKVIVNSQESMQEIWIAARSGGLHFRHDGTRWLDTRGSDDLYTALSRCLTEQAGQAITLTG
ncbi:iron donor protein CyaY [soil metagenome]